MWWVNCVWNKDTHAQTINTSFLKVNTHVPEGTILRLIKIVVTKYQAWLNSLKVLAMASTSCCDIIFHFIAQYKCLMLDIVYG